MTCANCLVRPPASRAAPGHLDLPLSRSGAPPPCIIPTLPLPLRNKARRRRRRPRAQVREVLHARPPTPPVFTSRFPSRPAPSALPRARPPSLCLSLSSPAPTATSELLMQHQKRSRAPAAGRRLDADDANLPGALQAQCRQAGRQAPSCKGGRQAGSRVGVARGGLDAVHHHHACERAHPHANNNASATRPHGYPGRDGSPNFPPFF